MSEFDDRRTWGPRPKYPAVLAAQNSAGRPIFIMGPCSIENEEQLDHVAQAVNAAHAGEAVFLRGGIWKAGTYPPPAKDFGLQRERLETLRLVGRRRLLKTIAEVLDVRTIEVLDRYVDAFQVGARHMQDYALLEELAKTDKVVTLKRGTGATLDEFLGAAEYLARGRCKPVLIERGGSTHMNHVRWDLSISLIAAVKRMTGLPILVDASHGTGRRDLVEPMTLAGLAAGADGFLVEVHPEPCKSLTDTDQAFPLDRLDVLLERSRLIYKTVRGWQAKDAGHSLTSSYAWGHEGGPEKRR